MKHRFLVNLTLCGVIEADTHTEDPGEAEISEEFVLTQNSDPGLLLGMLLSQLGEGPDFKTWSDQNWAQFKITTATDEHVKELGVIPFACDVDVALNHDACGPDCESKSCPWKPLGVAF